MDLQGLQLKVKLIEVVFACGLITHHFLLVEL